MYDAKFGAGSYNEAYVDVELIFGLNKDKTKLFLKNKQNKKELNNEIIEWYESNQDTKFKSREEYIEYFETKKSEAIKSELGE